MKFISINGAKPNPGHYSAATQKGNLLFISGQLPVDPFTGVGISGDITAETKQVLANVDRILEAAGAKKGYHEGHHLYFRYFLMGYRQFII